MGLTKVHLTRLPDGRAAHGGHRAAFMPRRAHTSPLKGAMSPGDARSYTSLVRSGRIQRSSRTCSWLLVSDQEEGS